MEKFSQFRDRGSSVSPFLPRYTPTTLLGLPLSILLFTLRLPLLLPLSLLTFILTSLIPLPSLCKKALLWLLLAIPGIWWIDLRIDAVKPGSLSSPENNARVPHPGNIIACTSTSPIDALYLAAIFDPIFTVAYPGSRRVRYISLWGAIFRALAYPKEKAARGTRLTTLEQLVKEHPKRIIAVFPECTTTNGQGVMPVSPCLLQLGDAKIYPLSLRYSPADGTTPVPGGYFSFLWRLLARSTHCIRVRIAEGLTMPETTPAKPKSDFRKDKYLQNVLGEVDGAGSESSATASDDQGIDDEPLSTTERKFLDRIADDLARLGRSKRVGLTVKDKIAFVDAWEGRSKKQR